MRSSFLPKCKPKITRISALPHKQESNQKNSLNSPKKKFYDPCLLGWAEILVILASRYFWLAFWEKRWPHKLILNLTDFYRLIIFRESLVYHILNWVKILHDSTYAVWNNRWNTFRNMVKQDLNRRFLIVSKAEKVF